MVDDLADGRDDLPVSEVMNDLNALVKHLGVDEKLLDHIPIEKAFIHALEADPDLVEEAENKRARIIEDLQAVLAGGEVDETDQLNAYSVNSRNPTRNQKPENAKQSRFRNS